MQARVDLLTASNLPAHEVLRDQRFTYHYYSIHQARVIKDELELIMKEYIFAYNNYQRSINAVLINSMDAGIGDRSRIKKKMNELNLQVGKVDKTIQSSINIKDLNDKLNTLLIM